MAVTCPECGRQYDITLFQFGNAVDCDCGASFRLEGNKRRTNAPGSVPPPGQTPSEQTPVIGDDNDPETTEAEFVRSSDPELVDMEPVELPIDGTLDLHTFAPSDVKDLIPDYLEACREKGILRVRVIHGKGTGELMRTVQAILKRLPTVESFEFAGPMEGGNGATIVRLR